MDTPETLTLTLPRKQWSLLVWLSGRGAMEVLDYFVKSKGHELACISEAAVAVKAFQDAYKKLIPDAEQTIAEDTLPPPPVLPN